MSATIHYHDIGDYLSREEKLRIIDDFGDIAAVPWQIITPDKHGDWLNKRDSEFDDYIPLAPSEKFDYLSKSFFTVNSSGLKTGMDSIAIGYSWQGVAEAVKKQTGHSDSAKVVEYSYRPFNRQWLYYDRETNQRQYRIPAIFPPEEGGRRTGGPGATGGTGGEGTGATGGTGASPSRLASPSRPTRHPNKVIWVTGIGGDKEFSCHYHAIAMA